MDKNRKGLGKKIKLARIRAGLVQSELADRIGVTQNYISLIETGKKMPSLKTFTKIARELDVSPSELLSGEQLGNELKKLAEQFDLEQIIQALRLFLEENGMKHSRNCKNS